MMERESFVFVVTTTALLHGDAIDEERRGEQ